MKHVRFFSLLALTSLILSACGPSQTTPKTIGPTPLLTEGSASPLPPVAIITESPQPTENSPALTPVSPSEQEALKAEWGGVVQSVIVMFAVCETTYNNHVALQLQQITKPVALADLIEKAHFFALAQGWLLTYEDLSPRVASYRLDLDNLGFEMADLITRLQSGELGGQPITTPLGNTCSDLLNAQDQIISATFSAGLTTTSVSALEQNIAEILSAIYD